MTVYFDENIPPHLAKGFNIIQSPENIKKGRQNITVKYLPDEFGYGSKDIDWIPKLGKQRAFVITQDLKITKRKDEIQAYRNAGLGILILRGKSKKTGLSVWEMLMVLTKNWEGLVSIMQKEKGAFAFSFGLKGKPKKLR